MTRGWFNPISELKAIMLVPSGVKFSYHNHLGQRLTATRIKNHLGDPILVTEPAEKALDRTIRTELIQKVSNNLVNLTIEELQLMEQTLRDIALKAVNY